MYSGGEITLHSKMYWELEITYRRWMYLDSKIN